MLNLPIRNLVSTKTVKAFYSTSTYFISTPIFYVNAAPHLGHLYTALIADAAHRFHKLTHPDESTTVFCTGTDEHGLKVQQSANSSNPTDIQHYCDNIAAKYQQLFDLCGITYSNFIRTTDKSHVEAVQHFWTVLESRGHIYSGKYSGWYCIPDEMFVSERHIQTIKDHNGTDIKVSELSGHRVEWTEETNYMFRLSSFRSDLLYWLKDEGRIVPFKYHQILNNWLEDEQMTSDISVSRPKSRIPWGIAVPSNEDHNIYVWLDALVNYLTVVQYPNLQTWPPSVQVIGKDILKFHGVYWPIFLMAAGLEPPSKLLVHSHWTVNDVKMSKSKNNVIDPFEKVKEYTVDGFRYFLLRQGVPHCDGDYTESKLITMLNAELANTFGNLLNRCVGKIINSKQIFPSFDEDEYKKLYNESESLKVLSDSILKLEEDVYKHYSNFNFYLGIEKTMDALRDCNKFFDDCKPWELAKNESDFTKLMCVIHVTLETLRICSVALQPIVPNICRKVFEKLNIPRERTGWSTMKPTWAETSCRPNVNILNSESVILYKKLSK